MDFSLILCGEKNFYRTAILLKRLKLFLISVPIFPQVLLCLIKHSFVLIITSSKHALLNGIPILSQFFGLFEKLYRRITFIRIPDCIKLSLWHTKPIKIKPIIAIKQRLKMLPNIIRAFKIIVIYEVRMTYRSNIFHIEGTKRISVLFP